MLCVVLQLRLTPEQLDAKTALESAVEEVKQELAGENDDSKKDALTAELKEKETKLDTLMAEFEVQLPHPARSLLCSPQTTLPVLLKIALSTLICEHVRRQCRDSSCARAENGGR